MTKNSPGAMEALLVFAIGIYFAIPSQINIGYMIIDALETSNIFGINIIIFKGMFSLLGVVIIIAYIFYIAEQLKKGNF